MKSAVVVIACALVCPPLFGGDPLFSDGFETGDTTAWTRTEYGPSAIILPGGVQMSFQYVPAGTYWMGSPEYERGRIDSEDLHEVTLTSGFYLGTTEVTQAQWEAVMGVPADLTCEGGPFGSGPDRPVYCVSWDDVCGGSTGVDCTPSSFIGRLNTHAGSTLFRLPTDAEWERAARAFTYTRFSHGDVLECDDFCEPCAGHDPYMWYCGNDSGQNEPVGLKLPNPLGLYDMHGNVLEWVADWWAVHLGTDPQTDPTGPVSGTYRVFRGGAALNAYCHRCRSASRVGNSTPTDRHKNLGFRVARSLEP